jgi:phosphate/phosphite/phosphonate ABC transporter binding protein
MKPLFHIGILLLVLFGLGACQPSPQEEEYTPQYTRTPPSALREYVFGVFPGHNPERLHATFGPIMEHLSVNIPEATFRLEASRDYAAFEEKLYSREFDFALPNPYQTVNALKYGYRVFGKMGDDEDFRGLILVRKDSPVQNVSDLKGKAVSFPAPTALAAAMLPQYFLHSQGLDVMKDIETRYVGSQESSMMNVYLGNVAAGATWPPAWRIFSRERPEIAAEMKVMWETESLLNNALVVRDDVPAEIAAQVEKLLLNLHEHEQGKSWLERMDLSHFEAASSETYEPVRTFLRRFNDEVRPVEHP